jgi:uncharacterized membrane protein YagU involved in acid resistance
MSRMNMVTDRPTTRQLFQHGIVGGIIAGIVFVLAEMLINVALGKPFLGPLRLISSILLGTQATAPTYSLFGAVVVGLIVHLILAAIFGVIFVYLLAWTGQFSATTEWLLLYGSVYGLALWVVNFHIIAPLLFPQFGQVNEFWNGFFIRTFFYGTVIGAYIAIVHSKEMIAGPPTERSM